MPPQPDIDEALETFAKIVEELPEEDPDTPLTESTTRLQLIDPILTDVLGWPRPCIDAELQAGSDRLDYRLGESRHTWFVLEAKKRAIQLVKKEGQNRPRFSLTGAVVKGACWEIIEKQMPSYLGRYNPDYGVVTNGEQWVGFLHRAKRSGRSLEEDYGVVFRSLDDIQERFEEFYNYFSVEGARGAYLSRVLEPDTQQGLVRGLTAEPVMAPSDVKALSYQDRKDFYSELQVAVEQAFQTIQDDPEALADCFVETRESVEADSRLERCAQLLTDSLDQASEKYSSIISGGFENFTNLIEEVDDLEEDLKGSGVLVRVTGEESSGKTVFLKRFYDHILDRSTRGKLVLLWIDGQELPQYEPNFIAQRLLDQIKKRLFGSPGPDVDQFRDLYIKKWVQFARKRGLDSTDTGGADWAEFVSEREEFERQEPFAALTEHFWYVVRSRQLLPCVIYDNIDTIEAARKCTSFSVALHKSTYALTTVSVIDTTVWSLREAREDVLKTLSPVNLWLPRPKVREVIENRVDYLKKVLSNEETTGHRAVARIGKSRGFKWDVDPDALARVVSAVLLGDQKISNWLGEFCNHNLREVLGLCRQVILSPHVKTEDLLRAQVVEARVRPDKVLRAIISPKHHQYVPSSDNDVMNVFGMWDDDDWAPLLPFRLLVYLREKKRRDLNQRVRVPGFVATEKIFDLFSGHLRVPEQVLRGLIKELWIRRLIELQTPHRKNPESDENRVGITPRGELHLNWAMEERQYVQMMAEVEPIIGEQAQNQLKKRHGAFMQALYQVEDNPTAFEMAYKRFVSYFVKYVVDSAETVAEFPKMEDFQPLRKEEMGLRKSWIRTEQ